MGRYPEDICKRGPEVTKGIEDLLVVVKESSLSSFSSRGRDRVVSVGTTFSMSLYGRRPSSSVGIRSDT